MVAACDLEVDVNGEEIFLVSKASILEPHNLDFESRWLKALIFLRIFTKFYDENLLSLSGVLSSFSGRLSKLFHKHLVPECRKTVRVILHNMPGGAEGFELWARFCYSNGRSIQITPSSAFLLHCVAEYMELAEEISPNLFKLTGKCLDEIPYWSWPEIMSALKQCQGFAPTAISSGIYDKILDSVAARITTGDSTPTVSSPESSAFRFSCDTRSTMSTRSSIHRAWWFDDLALLSPDAIQKVITSLIHRRVDHAIISRFLFHYLRCGAAPCAPSTRRKTIETVVDLLYSLDRNCVSCKGLFWILRVSSSLTLIKSSQTKLEEMIGCQIDQATVDSLLVPAPSGKGSRYDVTLVLRFLISFLASEIQPSPSQMKQVGRLIDSYLAEVAPDSSLQPSDFISLLTVLPDPARDSYDAVYQAVDLYLEVHSQLSEQDKMKICCAINYGKLSSESYKHLARNSKFPTRAAVQALISQQSKLKSYLQKDNTTKSRVLVHPPPKLDKQPKESQSNDSEHIVVHANCKLDLTKDNEKLKAQLQGIQWRVMELEKACKEMQAHMTKAMTKNRTSSSSASRSSLPRLCS